MDKMYGIYQVKINMNLYQNDLYKDDIRYIANLDLPWEKFAGSKILLSGASGLIGSILVDVLLEKNASEGLGCTVYALCRDMERAKNRFSEHSRSEGLVLVRHDVRLAFTQEEREQFGKLDYVLHLASHTHPAQYASDPVGTIATNIIGVSNMLDLAADSSAVRFVFTSSNEVYGENRGDVELFDEDYCGYINCNTLRAGYPESKRCSEALCQAYKAQKGLDFVILRFTRSYGPTLRMTCSKALSDFIRKGVAGEDIVLKSSGTQLFSYLYAADSASGLFTALLLGESGQAYNVADERSDIMLKDLAGIIASISGKQVLYEISGSLAAQGFSPVTKARLDGRKLAALGWTPRFDIQSGLERTISILREIR